MSYYITSYNGYALSDYGVVSPQVSGVHDLPAKELSITYIPGYDLPAVSVLGRRSRNVKFHLIIGASTHTQLISYLDSIKAILDPDDNFHPLIVSDRTSQRLMALSLGLPVDVNSLPASVIALETEVEFMVYPYWEDATPQTATIAVTPNMLTSRQATFEHSSIDGWYQAGAGVLTVNDAEEYSGQRCMKVAISTPADGALANMVSGVTAGQAYSLRAMLKGSVAVTVTVYICWYDSGNNYLGEAYVEKSVTTTWAEYKFENQTAPANAAKAEVGFLVVTTSSLYVDEVQFEQAAASTAFVIPADANTVIYNDGDKPCYPTYTLTISDTLASLTLTVGTKVFEYIGGLVATDVLVINTDPQAMTVTKNGTSDLANTDVDADFPPLEVGSNLITLSDATKMSLALSYRRRYR